MQSTNLLTASNQVNLTLDPNEELFYTPIINNNGTVNINAIKELQYDLLDSCPT